MLYNKWTVAHVGIYTRMDALWNAHKELEFNIVSKSNLNI